VDWTGQKKEMLRALQDADRIKKSRTDARAQRRPKNTAWRPDPLHAWLWQDRKKICTPGRQQKWKRPVNREKDAAAADRPAWTGLRGQTGQRQVQPVHYAGSTGFNQDGPGKNWLKTAELKFSSEVQLASSSWTRKFSSAGQASWAQKKILALKFIRILTFSPSFWKIIT
jgi:hypothetical protein